MECVFNCQVLIENKRAVGVEFKKGDKIMSVKANKEVILSAGAVGSPQILMLSGVGPKEHLEQLKVILINKYKMWSF